MSSAVSRAKVVAAKLLTPTVRWFQLQDLNSDPPRFYAGQWYVCNSNSRILYILDDAASCY